MRCTALAVSLAFSAAAVGQQIRIGGFTPGRGGGMSIESGQYLTQLRAGLAASNLGPVLYSSTTTITSSFLQNVDVMVLSSVFEYSNPIVGLSSSEQQALYDFVRGGGGLVVLADNSDFNVGNLSLTGAFGFEVLGYCDGTATPTVQHAVTNGVPFFNVGYGGALLTVPAAGQVLATLPSGLAVLGVLPHDALALRSGGVVIFTDSSFVFDGSIQPYAIQVVANAIHFAHVNPCYANCDASTEAPRLNANDFMCFLGMFAISSSYANCDGSTTPPVLNALDFSCFLSSFAQGCEG